MMPAPMRKRPSVLSGLWCLTAVFASAKRMRKLTANAIGGKDVSPRQVADGKRLRREIRVFPPQAQTVTKNHQRLNADASVRRVCGICGATRNKAHSLAIGREAANSARPRKIWKTWSKAERLSSLERRKRAVLNSSAEPIPCLRKAFMTD